MPKIGPLTPDKAKTTLINRLAGTVDRVRQINTNFGLRSQRVFLVWTKYSGQERGDGREIELRRKEILPTPKVGPMNAISFTASTGGVMPVGTQRVQEISLTFTADELQGMWVPEPHEEIPDNYRFYYEIVEDGRGDRQAERQRFRLSAKPWRNESNVCWDIILERVSLDADRCGKTPDE